MLFYQHVYGRVTKGYRSGAPGYQLAALSDPINDDPELIAKLNQLSFFNTGRGKGTELRFSFFSPAKGLLAFGCSRLARDRSGAIGTFAHHFICREDDFISSSASPVGVLIHLIRNSRFFENESKLPNSRSLAEESLEPESFQPAVSDFQMLSVHLANMYLDRSERTIPMVAASDDDAWSILAGVFALLPKLEASRMAFSTLFTEASEFAGNFRLLFIPDSKHVPSEVYNYTVFEPRAKPTTLPPSKPTPLIRFWLEANECFPLLLEIAHVNRHFPERLKEYAALVPKLLSSGKLFRECVANLQIPRIFDLILMDEKWIVEFSRSGDPLRYEECAQVLWNNPKTYLNRLLAAVHILGQKINMDKALADLASKATDGDAGIELIGDLSARDLNRFYEVVVVNLGKIRICQLAEKLRDEYFYRKQLHNHIAQYVVAEISESFRQERRQHDWVKFAQWLETEQGVLDDHSYARAALDLAIWTSRDGNRAFRLMDYRLGSEYQHLVEAVWNVSVGRDFGSEVFDACAYDAGHRDDYLSFLVRKLHGSKYSRQEFVLRIIALRYGSQAARNEDFIGAIRRSEHPTDLAEDFLALLEKNGKLDMDARSTLEKIARKSHWRLF